MICLWVHGVKYACTLVTSLTSMYVFLGGILGFLVFCYNTKDFCIQQILKLMQISQKEALLFTTAPPLPKTIFKIGQVTRQKFLKTYSHAPLSIFHAFHASVNIIDALFNM